MTGEELNQIRGVNPPSEELNRRLLRASTDIEGDEFGHGRSLKAVKTGFKNNWTEKIPKYQI